MKQTKTKSKTKKTVCDLDHTVLAIELTNKGFRKGRCPDCGIELLKQKTPPKVAAHRQYAISQLYAGLRSMGHSQEVATAMMDVVECDRDEARTAIIHYGDKIN